ncbi:MAG TPA: hypothetical protein VNB03_01870, partial [Casimicrobiaceae bacterium]|nr:hypothetical protein [Casimicrobiaceae bacterium]
YMGGGGGGRGSYGGGGGGFGGGFGGARAAGASGPSMSVPSAGGPSAGVGSRGATAGRGNWNGNGNWNGSHSGNWHGHGHGGHWYGYSGWYPYYGGWWWPAWGATIGLAATWPYWAGYYGDPGYTYYTPPATTYYYGAPSGTMIYRSDPQGTPVPQQAPAIRLYCPATNAFYPDVTQCSQQWLRVLPNDGAAPAPQESLPQSAPQPVPQSHAPATRPGYPNGSRGYDLTASSGTPQYVRASTTMASSMPVSATLVARNAAFEPVASSGTKKIAAPRMSLPGQEAPGSVVAELRAN